MPTTDDDARSTGSMTAAELAEEDGRVMGRALAGRPEAERAAWWRGIRSVMAPGAEATYRGLPEAPGGFAWGEDVGHMLRGPHGLAHLIPKPAAGMLGAYKPITAVCGMTPSAWVVVGRWETEEREACPQCAGQRVTS